MVRADIEAASEASHAATAASPPPRKGSSGPPSAKAASIAWRRLPGSGNFARIAPRPFLDDVTTKNVIIDGGAVSGIVDVDWLGYDDALMTPALAKVSLIASGQSTEYVDMWCDELKLTDAQTDVFDAYTALHCFVLLSEIGVQFNNDEPQHTDDGRTARLYDALLRCAG